MDAPHIPDAADPTQAATRKMSPTQMHGLLAAGGSGVTRELRGWQPPSVEDLQRMLPQYEITAFIAHGGMGAVYKGVQRSLDRTVAIKILPPDLVDDGEANYAERFKQEARAMAKFKHFGIVTVYEAGEVELQGQGAARQEGQAGQAGTLLYFVMEFIEGTDVAQLVAAQGRLTPEHALSITTQVCEALAYAHSRGVVHRDIKPSNVMIDADGQVKVADFGLAKMAVQDDGGLTRSNVAMGTPDFLAPESLIPGMQVDQRADLYAVGVMLYQMLTGQVPRGRFSPISTVVPKSDPKLDAIVDKAMQTDREKRYSTATELKADVERVFQLVPKERARRTSWKTRPTALAAAAVIVLGAAAVLLSRHGTGGGAVAPVTADPTAIVSIPGLPDLPPLKIPPGEPGLVKEFEVKGRYLTGIQLLPDSRRLLVFPARSVALIDLETETPIWSITGGEFTSSAVNQDGSRFVIYEIQGLDGKHAMPMNGQQAQIRLHDTSTGRLIQIWTVPITPMSVAYRQVALSPSGKRIVARTGDNSEVGKKHLDAQFVALEEGEEAPVMRWTAAGHHGHVTLAVDEDRYLSTGNGAPVLMSFGKPGEPAPLLGDMAELNSALSADKRHLVATEAGNMAVWNLASRQREFYLERAPKEGPLWYAGNGLILNADTLPTRVGGHSTLLVWDGSTGQLLAKLANAKPDETFSDLLAGAANGTFCVARVKHDPVPKTGEPNLLQIWRLPKPGQVHASAVASPGGTTAVAATSTSARSWVKVNFVGMKITGTGNPGRSITAEELKTNSGLKLMNHDLWMSGGVPGVGQMQNGAIRVRFKRSGEELGVNGCKIDILLRGDKMAVGPTQSNTVLFAGSRANPASRLPNLPTGLAPPMGQEMELEIGCVGKQFVMKRDGTLIGTRELPVLDPAGAFSLQGSEVIITSAELINLDGLPEAEALKVLGVE